VSKPKAGVVALAMVGLWVALLAALVVGARLKDRIEALETENRTLREAQEPK